MSRPAQLLQLIRQFLDVAMHRSLRERVHVAKTTGLSLAQLGILMHLHHMGWCGVSEISDHFDISPAGASQLVDRLVQAGLVERREDPDDRRARTLALTAKGVGVIERAAADRYRWVEDLVSEMDSAEREAVARVMRLLTSAAEQLEAGELPASSRKGT